jgi:hypothetical protein
MSSLSFLCIRGHSAASACTGRDRCRWPDFVESSEVVAQGHFQYEVDFTSSSESRASPGLALFSTPALLKYGIVKDFEIRVAPNGYMRQNG